MEGFALTHLEGGDFVDLTLTTQDMAGRTVVSVTGELDIYSAPVLRTRLGELAADGSRSVVVDLGGVGFLDSTGLGVLVGGLRRTRESGGDLRLVVTTDRILRVFTITSLTEVFDIYPTLESALGDGGGSSRGDLQAPVG